MRQPLRFTSFFPALHASRFTLHAFVSLLFLAAAGAGEALADLPANPYGAIPSGAQVTAGIAAVEEGIGTVTVRQTTQAAVINWQSFNIGQGAVTRFIQPSATAMVLNRIGGLTPSMINGALEANGMVFLLNRNGILFGPTAQVNVAGGLVGSTLHLTDADFLAGRFRFEGAVTDGLISNRGNLLGVNGVYLFAPNVENHGVITSPGGSIVLAAGSTAYLSNRADGRGFLAELRAPAGRALNVGQMIADGGQITMAGLVVNQNGLTQANAVRNVNGRIELVADSIETGADSRMLAEAGDIWVEGRTIVHRGSAKAGSQGDRSGHITFMARDSLTFGATSRTSAQGGPTGISNGGTIIGMAIGMASNLAAGNVQVESGAEFDVSGGATGGHGGELLLGDRRGAAAGFDSVGLRATAAPGYQPGRFRLIPADLTLDHSVNLWELAPLRDVTLAALNDLTVRGPHNLAEFSRGVPHARLRLLAGNDLKFQDAHIRNGEFFELGTNTVLPRELIGVAGNNVTLGSLPDSFDNRASTIVMGDGGSLSLTARNGSIRLIDPVTGLLSSLHIRAHRILGGGNLSVTARQNIITANRIEHGYSEPLVFNMDQTVSSTLQGILVDGTMVTGADGSSTRAGRLTMMTQEGNLLGGTVWGAQRSPGFMVRNADARVSVGGNIGSSGFRVRNADGSVSVLPLDAGGLLPDGARTFELANPQPGPDGTVPFPVIEDPSTYLNIAMTNAHVSVEAGGHVFFKRAKDAGLFFEADGRNPGVGITEWINGEPIARPLSLTDGFQHNRLSVTSERGNIFVNTNDSNAAMMREPAWSIIGGYLPANTDLRALNGTIQFRSPIRFLNADAARLNFFAAGTIEGFVRHGLQGPGEHDVAWVFVQDGQVNPLNPGLDRWYPIDLRRPIPLELLRWRGVNPPRGARSLPTHADLPLSFSRLVAKNTFSIELSPQSPEVLLGRETNFGSSTSPILRLLQEAPVGADKPLLGAPGLIQFQTGSGDIRNMTLLLRDQAYLKETVLKSGGDIRNITLSASVPQLGSETRTMSELIPVVRDSQTGSYRLPKRDEALRASDVRHVPVEVRVNVPRPAVVVEAAGTIDLNLAGATASSGLRLVGDGVASVRAGRDLNLGNSLGIRLSPGVTARGPTMREGLLDLAVGNNLLMTQSLIMTDGGAGILIRGLDRAYIPGYDNSALHPVEVPIEVPGTVNRTVNRSLVGGNVEVGTSVRSEGSGESTGIQVRSGGSVGVRASRDRTVVTTYPDQPDRVTVTVALEKDPTAIDIQARGDVNVNTSRIATFATGDIRIVSTQGSINAGSGGKNEQQLFQLDVPQFDALGNPILIGGMPQLKRENYLVPGSGIFTFHPLDPTTLDFPKFDTPAMSALKVEITKQRFFGRNTSALEARFNVLSRAREVEFDAIFERFITENPDKPEFLNGQPTGRLLPLDLGDISLNAGLDIVVPPAGIRGRRVDLIAGRTLDFQGGEIQGKVTFRAQNLAGDVRVTGTFAGSSVGGGSVSVVNSGGSGSVGGLTGATGTVAATSASTSASVSSTQSVTESVQEAVADVANQQRSQQVAKNGNGKGGDGKKQIIAIRARQGVEIEVDVKPKAGPSGG